MAIRTIDNYSIGLEVQQSDRTKQNIENLRASFSDVSKSLEDISKEYADIIKQEGDHTDEAKAYNKLLGDRLADLEKENQMLQATSTEQGKLARDELHNLKETQKQRRLNKDELKRLKVLEASFVDLTDEEIEERKRANQQLRIQIRTTQQGLRQEMTHRKTLAQLVKADLKGAKDRLKLQLDFIKSLKTTEGRYAALKKAAAIGAKGAKAAGKAAIGAVGVVGGIVGGAVSGAENQVNAEAEARRLKVPGMSSDEKMALIGRLRIETPYDSAAIVDAINRTTNAVKSSNPDDIAQMAQAELEFPGMAALFQASGKDAKPRDFAIMQNRMRALQGATGSNIGDLSSVMQTVSNMRDSAFKSGVSQQDLVALYAALQGSNAFDDQEHIERAMHGFLAQGGLNADNFYDRMADFDWAKYVYGSQQKNQADAFSKTFDFGALKVANTAPVNDVVEKTAAEKAAETARRVAIKKDELVARILTKIEPLLNDGTLENVIEMLFKVLETVLPLIKPVMDLTKKILDALDPVIEKVVDIINRIVSAFTNAKGIKDFFEKLTGGSGDGANVTEKSHGGIAIGPSIVGERGAEAVIPLDFARFGRAQNIIQTVNQTFNMSGNQTTAMSLGQAVKQRSFTDSYLSLRMYGG